MATPLRIFILFSVLSTAGTSKAQYINPPSNIASRHFYMKDGLPDEVITSVVQDDKGFLWLGTSSGIAKFDGYTFTVFQNDPYSSNSLVNNSVNSILLEKSSKLWIGHNEGLDLFDLTTERFIFHWYDSALEIKGLNISVKRITQRKDDKLWVFTNRGLYIADTQTRSIRRQQQLPSDSDYNHIIETNDGSLWAATENKLIHVDHAGQITSYQHDSSQNHSLSSNAVKRLYIDSSGRLWVGTTKGLNLFIPTRNHFRRFLMPFLINAFIEHPDGTMWIGTDWGLHTLNPETGESKTLADIFSFTFSIIKDKQGTIWVASMQGLHQFYIKLKKFNTYRSFGNNIGYLAEDENQQIWMATMTGLFQFDHKFKDVVQHRKTRYPGMVTSIYSDRRGAVWFASDGKIERYDLKKKTCDSTIIEGLKLPVALLVDSRGKIWVGAQDHIGKYDPMTREYRRQDLLPQSVAHSFLEDSSQNIWMATSAGLARYNIKEETFDVYKNDPNDKHSISNNIVYSILKDQRGALWIGTDGGLNKIIPGTENEVPQFHHWRSSNSNIPNDNVYTVLDGKDGSLWMSCGNMISRFFPKRNEFHNYYYEDDSPDKPAHVTPGGDFKQGTFSGRGLISSVRQIYFGTNRGLIVFHPDSLKDNPYVPPVAITSFFIHDSRVPIKGSNSDTLSASTALDQAISATRKIILNHWEDAITFEFSALNFVKPENNAYKYKLEPYENTWISATAGNRVARYTNLSPGTYTFRAIGSNNDGVWNEDGVSLTIVITPPWWQTWWAYSLYGLVFIGLTLSWRRYDLKRAKLKHRTEHLSELDQLKSRFFTNISHEFRTPITLILGPLKKFYHNASKKDEKEELRMMIRNGERLHRLINQLLDLSKLEAGKMKLHASPTEITEFLKEIASSYESMAIDKKIKYIFYPEVQELRVYIDQEKISKVVHNLLTNAFKFTKTGGEIILDVKKEGGQCLISVRDSGIGIPSDEIDKVFDRFYQVDSSQTRVYEGSGLGMALAKELIDLHHGKISVNSTEGKGSIFTLTLLLGKEHLAKDEISNEEFSLSEQADISDVVIPAETGEGTTPTPTPVNKPTILIIEDNQDMRTYIRKILLAEYQILEAGNGKDGVMLAQENIPELIISDIMMPEMDGHKVCALVKNNELTSHIPLILLTAKADRESKLTGLETGADDYLSKPFDAEELRLIIRNRIQERRKMRERFSREIILEPKHISITSLDEQFLAKVLAIIEEHIDDEHFSIDELSRQAGYSNMHFYRKIKALSGQTPSLFLRMIRLKRAADLLSRHSDNVAQVAYAVGFSSLSYFNKCFKEQFGVTPGKYTELRKQSH